MGTLTLTDMASGQDVHRPQPETMVGFVPTATPMVVHSICHIARNLDDLRGIV